jgi:hypothetical protein
MAGIVAVLGNLPYALPKKVAPRQEAKLPYTKTNTVWLRPACSS